MPSDSGFDKRLGSSFDEHLPVDKKTRWPKKTIVVIVVLVIVGVWSLIASLAHKDDAPSTGNGGVVGPTAQDLYDDAPSTGNGGVVGPTAQDLYNGFLRVARSQVRDTPDFTCNPNNWDVVSGLVQGATGSQRVLIELALGDACKQAGLLGGLAHYSAYYSAAPP